jgi:hypothetical protein
VCSRLASSTATSVSARLPAVTARKLAAVPSRAAPAASVNSPRVFSSVLTLNHRRFARLPSTTYPKTQTMIVIGKNERPAPKEFAKSQNGQPLAKRAAKVFAPPNLFGHRDERGSSSPPSA